MKSRDALEIAARSSKSIWDNHRSATDVYFNGTGALVTPSNMQTLTSNSVVLGPTSTTTFNAASIAR